MNFLSKDSLSRFSNFLVNSRKDLLVDAQMGDTVDELDNSHLLKGPLDILLRHGRLLDDVLEGKALTFVSSDIVH